MLCWLCMQFPGSFHSQMRRCCTGTHGNVGQVNYSAAKAGVLGLTRTVAKEWGAFGVRCNCVTYGFINTRLTQVTWPYRAPRAQARVCCSSQILFHLSETHMQGEPAAFCLVWLHGQRPGQQAKLGSSLLARPQGFRQQTWELTAA